MNEREETIMSDKAKELDNLKFKITGDIIKWEGSVIKIANISYITNDKFETPAFPKLSVVLIILGWIFRYYNAAAFGVCAVVGIAWICYWYYKKTELQNKTLLTLAMNSGTRIPIVFHDKAFLFKVLSVLEEVMKAGSIGQQNITVSIENCDISGDAKILNGYDKYIPKAEQCYKTVIRFREKNLAKNSNDLADVYLEYSNFLYQIGEKTRSSYFANEAHIIYFGLYGEESYHVLQCLNNKALILWEEGKIEEALKMYRDIVKRAANMRNIPFDDVCMDYQNYADLLEHTDQYEEAMEYYKKYIRLIKQNVSENSPKLAQSYIGMANCHMGMGDYETAVKYLEKLAPFTKDDSLLERLMHHKIGTCAAFIGKDDMAADHLEKALQLCDENGILDRGYIYVDLCIIYYRMKQNDKAIFCGKEAKKFAANFKDTAFDEYVHNLDIILEEKQNI